jgi:hypothetical protein
MHLALVWSQPRSDAEKVRLRHVRIFLNGQAKYIKARQAQLLETQAEDLQTLRAPFAQPLGATHAILMMR